MTQPATITGQVAAISQRVSALENQGFDSSSGIAKITKVYGNIQITYSVSAKIHQYPICGDTQPLAAAICSSSLYV